MFSLIPINFLLPLQEWNAMLVPEKRRIRISVHLSALLLLK